MVRRHHSSPFARWNIYDICIRRSCNATSYFISVIYFNFLRYLLACYLSFTFCDFDTVDLEIYRVDRSISAEVESIDRVDSSRVDQSNLLSEHEVESVDNID